MSRRLHRMNKIDILHMFNHQKQFSPAEFKMIIKLLADDINLNPSEPDSNGGGKGIICNVLIFNSYYLITKYSHALTTYGKIKSCKK